MNAYQQIIGLLGQLNTDELAQLSQRIKSLRALSSGITTKQLGNVYDQVRGGEPDEDDSEFMVLKCASDFMQSVGADPCNTMPMLRRSVNSSFREKLPGLLRYLRDNAHQRVTQQALLRLGFKLLYQDMIDNNYPVTTKTLLNHLHRIPSVLEKHFPGYRQAGALAWTVSRSPTKSP